MFTGIVTACGRVAKVERNGERLGLTIEAPFDDLVDGESVAVGGVCLTVVEHGARWFRVEAVVTTLGRTCIAEWAEGRRVNLERAMAVGDRLGGHLVQGHVDAVGRVLSRAVEGQGARLRIELPAPIAPLVAEKGSIAVDGISLTVAAVGRDWFEVALIPETLARTTLGAAQPGTAVNLEADVVARHVARLREFGEGPGVAAGDLARWGYGGTR
jgi:riboflavin synthase